MLEIRSSNSIIPVLLNVMARPILNLVQPNSLSRSRRDPLKHFEIPVLRHICKLRKIPIEQENFTNEHVI